MQESPVVQQFVAMDFCPRLDNALLRSGKRAADTVDRIDGEHGAEFLVHRVEMRTMMWRADFGKHPDDDSEEPRDFRHGRTLLRRPWSCRANATHQPRRSARHAPSVACEVRFHSRQRSIMSQAPHHISYISVATALGQRSAFEPVKTPSDLSQLAPGQRSVSLPPRSMACNRQCQPAGSGATARRFSRWRVSPFSRYLPGSYDLEWPVA